VDLAEFEKFPLMGILRGVTDDMLQPLIETVISSGLKTLEITMNTDGAQRLIRKARQVAGERLAVGAGTVLSRDELQAALDAGASFIVMPALMPDIVSYCVQKRVPVFPGALTPREVYEAWKAGATMVKVFPAKMFGPGYIRELKGPFRDIKLLACGGVNTSTIKSFFESGASAVAFGSGIFKRELLAGRDYVQIGRSIKALIAAMES